MSLSADADQRSNASAQPDISEGSFEEDEDADLDKLCALLLESELTVNETTVKSLSSSLDTLLQATSGRLQAQMNSVDKRLSTAKHEYSRLVAKGCAPSDKFFHLMYVMPYFRDRKRFIPPPNRDSVQIRKEGLMNMLITPLPKWRSDDVEILRSAIRTVLKRSLLHMLGDNLRLATEKLQNLEDLNSEMEDADGDQIEQVKLRIMNAERELEEVKSNGDLLNRTYNDPNAVHLIEWDVVSQMVTQGQRRRHAVFRTQEDCQHAWLYAYAPWINRSPWTEEEMANLYKIGTEMHWRRWNVIASKLGTSRTAFECAQAYLDNEYEKRGEKKWTEAEDKILLNEVDEIRVGDYIPWRVIALALENRSICECRQRYQVLITRRGRWKREEDKKLLQAVRLYGEHAWTRVSSKVGGRTATQCRARYIDCLSMKYRSSMWSSLEDDILQLGIEVFGRRWVTIAKLLVGRTANQVKMRVRALEQKKGDVNQKAYAKKLKSKWAKCQMAMKEKDALRQELMFRQKGDDLDGDILSAPSLHQFLSTLQPAVRERLETGLAKLKEKYEHCPASAELVDGSEEEEENVPRRRSRRVRKKKINIDYSDDSSSE